MAKKTLTAPKRVAKKTKRKPAQFAKRMSGFCRVLLKASFMMALWTFMIGGFILFWFFQELPPIEKLKASVRRPSVIIQASDGTTIGSYGDLHAETMRLQDLPPHVSQALIAVEDNRFYSHFGLDMIGLSRAMYTNYKAGRVVQGGSTITQQLAKNFLLSQKLFPVNDRSYKRKMQELLLALWLEWHFTKDQIMTIYLNRVYFGSGTYGIEAAAQRFFDKSAKELTVFEAALIAGLLQAPSRYSPAANPERSKKRATSVMVKMKDLGYIRDYTHYLKQGSQQLENIRIREGKSYRYFTDWIYEAVPDLIDGFIGDVVVTTTLDTKAQDHAEYVVSHYIKTLGRDLKASQAAMLAMRPDGAIVAMVGGSQYGKTQFNRATQALRQPGSAFKPFIYLTALENGYTTESLIEDTPVVIGSWKPKNFKYISQGEITMAMGLIKSVNAVSIRLCQAVGPKKVLDLAHRFGISNSMYPTLSLALGTMEMTLLDLVSAFSVFANQGKPVYGYGIEEIRDQKGRILYSHKPIRARAIVSEENLHQINDMLRRVVSEGTGRRINIDHTVIGKTGSNDNKDAYFIGYRGGAYNEDTIDKGIFDVTFGVWVGNDNMALMHRTSLGSNMPLKIAKAFLLGKIPDEDLKTKHVDKARVPEARHYLATKHTEALQEVPNISDLLD